MRRESIVNVAPETPTLWDGETRRRGSVQLD
jgi:hypothetical protein